MRPPPAPPPPRVLKDSGAGSATNKCLQRKLSGAEGAKLFFHTMCLYSKYSKFCREIIFVFKQQGRRATGGLQALTATTTLALTLALTLTTIKTEYWDRAGGVVPMLLYVLWWRKVNWGLQPGVGGWQLRVACMWLCVLYSLPSFCIGNRRSLHRDPFIA